MSENDVYVQKNLRRLPWWVMPRMMEQGAYWSDDSVCLWAIPGCRMSVRRLRKGRKGHRGKMRPTSAELLPSTSVRKAIERWGRL